MANNYKKWTPEQREKWNKFSREYSANHFITISVKLSKTCDQDIINFLFGEGDGKLPRGKLSSDIKKMIRNEMNKNK